MKRLWSIFRQGPAVVFLHLLVWVVAVPVVMQAGESTRFEKVSESCHYMRLDGGNVAVVVGADGVLMVNPPDEVGLGRVREALGRLSSAPVRWLAFTEPRYVNRAGTRHYAGLGAQLVGNRNLYRLFMELNGEADGAGQAEGARGLPGISKDKGALAMTGERGATREGEKESRADWNRPEMPTRETGSTKAEGWVRDATGKRPDGTGAVGKRAGEGKGQSGISQPEAPLPWFLFDDRMRIYPGGLEVQIFSVRNRARSGGDVALYLPTEKVLLVGDLYESARYPEINVAARGDASGWFEGMGEVIGAVPLLKPAIARNQPKEGVTLEETVTVISARDVPSNLQNMKDLLEDCQKLRREITRAVQVGRSLERLLSMPTLFPYRSYGNLDSFARQLYDALGGTP
ncbi:MAG: hypothetical protein GXX81_09665 [Acidobacteria bacterium]|jgi:hypothetical protein|nr:hypothetical protein [Acidobacteriota bacterium]